MPIYTPETQFIITDNVRENDLSYIICKKDDVNISFCSSSILFENLEQGDMMILSKGKYEMYVKNKYINKVLDYDQLNTNLQPFFTKGFVCYISFLKKVFPFKYYPSLNNRCQEIYDLLIQKEDEDIFVLMNKWILSFILEKYNKVKKESVCNYVSFIFKCKIENNNFTQTIKYLSNKTKVGKYNLLTEKNIERILIAWKDIYLCKNFILLGLSYKEVYSIFENTNNDYLFSGNKLKVCDECKKEKNEEIVEHLELCDWCVLCSYKDCENTNILIDLYQKILKNPFVILRNIDLNLAYEIFVKTHDFDCNQSITKDLKNIAYFLNKIEESDSFCYDLKDDTVLIDFFKGYKSIISRVYGIITVDDKIYSYRKFKIEQYLANFLNKCLKGKTKSDSDNGVIGFLKNLKTEENACVILTGGPGTGKTTNLQEVCKYLSEKEKTFCLASYTGKAVCRIKEKVEFKDKIFTLDYIIARKLTNDFEYLLIDESSMIHAEIFYTFLKSLKSNNLSKIKIILVGDENQLPPVSWGEVFFSYSKYLKGMSYFKLEKVYRYSDKLLEFVENFKKDIFLEDNVKIYSKIDTESKLKEVLDAEKCTERKIITIYNEDVDKINNIIKQGKKDFVIGDEVILTKNIYKTDINLLANGSLGTIVSTSPLGVKFEQVDEIEYFPKEDQNLIKFGYCLTVHKMQGSECDTIIFYIPSFKKFITKSIFYTAITRSKNNLILIFKERNYISEINNIMKNKDVERINNFSNLIKIKS